MRQLPNATLPGEPLPTSRDEFEAARRRINRQGTWAFQNALWAWMGESKERVAALAAATLDGWVRLSPNAESLFFGPVAIEELLGLNRLATWGFEGVSFASKRAAAVAKLLISTEN